MTKKCRGTAPHGRAVRRSESQNRKRGSDPFPQILSCRYLDRQGTAARWFSHGTYGVLLTVCGLGQDSRARLQSTFSKEAVAASLYPPTVRRVPTGCVIYAWLRKAYLSGATRAKPSLLWNCSQKLLEQF